MIKDKDLIKKIFLITIDNLRSDHIGCYNNQFSTPNIEYIASHGIVFEKCVSCITQTTPSHASILTSSYPFKHGALVNGLALNNREVKTLSEIMTSQGYLTAGLVGVETLSSKYCFNRGYRHFYNPKWSMNINIGNINIGNLGVKIKQKNIKIYTLIERILNILHINF